MMKQIGLLVSCLLAMPLVHALQTTKVARPVATAAPIGQAAATENKTTAGAGAGAGAGAAGAGRIIFAGVQRKAAEEESIRNSDTAIAIEPIDFGAQLTALIAEYRALSPAEQIAATATFWPRVDALVETVLTGHAITTDEHQTQNAKLIEEIDKLKKENADLQTRLTKLEEAMRKPEVTNNTPPPTDKWGNFKKIGGGVAAGMIIDAVWQKKFGRRCIIS